MKKEILELELYDSCITLKNLAIVNGAKPFSGEFLYTMLMENAVKLKPIYREMLLMYRQGRDEEAFRYFADAVNTKAGRNFSHTDKSREDKSVRTDRTDGGFSEHDSRKANDAGS